MYYEQQKLEKMVRTVKKFQQFFKITLPLLTPTIFFSCRDYLLSILYKVFDQAFVLTAGGPANATKTTVYYLYEQGFQYLPHGAMQVPLAVFCY